MEKYLGEPAGKEILEFPQSFTNYQVGEGVKGLAGAYQAGLDVKGMDEYRAA